MKNEIICSRCENKEGNVPILRSCVYEIGSIPKLFKTYWCGKCLKKFEIEVLNPYEN